MKNHFVPCSGGKDSTALLLRLIELEPEGVQPVITPTEDELPEMEAHWLKLEQLTGKTFTRIQCPSLMDLIDKFEALPNYRMRWCTRLIKIVPFEAFIKAQGLCVVSVGLRFDEPSEVRSGMEMDLSEVTQRFPLREWGWRLKDVVDYLKARGVTVPKRTDCGCCFFQRIHEWHSLWQEHPERWTRYEALEARIGHTFRSPHRDSWPAALKDMRAEFERGRKPLKRKEPTEICRACSL